MSEQRFEVLKNDNSDTSVRIQMDPNSDNNNADDSNETGLNDNNTNTPTDENTDVGSGSNQSGTDENVAGDDITEDKIFSFFEKNYGKKLTSIDDLFKEPEPKIIEKEMELPDNVAAFNKFHRETGGSISDFVNLNRDFNAMDDDQVLAEYYAAENPGWTKQDVAAEIADRFHYDPEDVEEREKQRIERLKKSELSRAKEFLNSRKEKYRAELASSSSSLSEEDKAELEAYKQYKSSIAEQQRVSDEKSSFFEQETKKVFSTDFKGFEFKIGDKDFLFKPDEPSVLMEKQMNLPGWLESFKDENGFVKNTKEFHKVLSIAMNHESYLKHFYEQGKADAIREMEKESRNINLTPQSTQQTFTTGKGVRFEIEKNNNNDHRVRIKQ